MPHLLDVLLKKQYNGSLYKNLLWGLRVSEKIIIIWDVFLPYFATTVNISLWFSLQTKVRHNSHWWSLSEFSLVLLNDKGTPKSCPPEEVKFCVFAVGWCAGGHKPDPQGQKWHCGDGKRRMFAGQGAFSGCVVYVHLQTMVLHVPEWVKPENPFISVVHKGHPAVLPWVQATPHCGIQASPNLPDGAFSRGGIGNSECKHGIHISKKKKSHHYKVASVLSVTIHRCTHNLVTPSCLHMDILLTSPWTMG